MGFLLHIVLAVGCFGAAQSGLIFAQASWPWALLLVALPYGWGGLADRAGRAGQFRLSAMAQRMVGLSGPAGFGLLVLGTDWLQAVRSWTGAELAMETWPEFALFLAFVPYPLLQIAAVHAEVAHHAPPGAMRRRAFHFQLRMLASALLPLILYVYVTAQVGVIDGLRLQIQEVGLVHAGFMAFLLAGLALILPSLLTSAWDTVSMPPSPQRDVLDAVAARASFKPRDVRVWRTGNLMSNAAIVGVGERRVVLFSDSLLASLPPRELAAVYGHEIGHAKRRHVGVFLVWTLGFFLGADWLAATVAPENDWLAVGILLGALVGWALGFGWLSRRCELEADLYSLELLQDPAGMTLALERVGGRLNDVGGWRHFSSRDRVQFLWRAWAEPDFARAFRRRLRRVAWVGVALFVLSSGAQLWSLIDRYPGDQVRVQLALGHWTRALEGARDLDDLEPEDLELLELGAAKQGQREALPYEELEGGLEASLTAGLEWSRCQEYAGLLVLAGRGEYLAVLDLCSAMVEDDEAGARALLEDCPPRWRDLLREALSS